MDQMRRMENKYKIEASVTQICENIDTCYTNNITNIIIIIIIIIIRFTNFTVCRG